MKFSLGFCALLFFVVFAHAKDNPTARSSFGGGVGPVFGEANPQVTKFDKATSYFIESDFGEIFAFHFGLAGFGYQDGKAILYGKPETRTEFYTLFFEGGPKFFFPIPYITPWVGAGGLAGDFIVSNPLDRKANDMNVIFDREFKFVSGLYGHAGVDFWAGQAGLRFSYTHYYLRTDAFNSLNNDHMNFHFERYSASLLILY